MEHGPAEPVPRIDIKGRHRHRRAQTACLRPGFTTAGAKGSASGGRLLGPACLQRSLEGMLVSVCKVGMERAQAPRVEVGGDLWGSPVRASSRSSPTGVWRALRRSGRVDQTDRMSCSVSSRTIWTMPGLGQAIAMAREMAGDGSGGQGQTCELMRVRSSQAIGSG
jgi:hypothetical protein